MAVRRLDDRRDDKTTILRVTIPKVLLTEIRETKRLCKENGLIFDIKPDVTKAIEKAIDEAKKAVSAETGAETQE